VLASLLNGTHFNYVMQASDADPRIPARVIISPRTKDSGAQIQVGQAQVSSAAATSTGSEPDVKQLMRELLTQAQAELANSGGIVFDNHGEAGNAGDADPASTAQQPDAVAFLKLVEAQIPSIGDAAATDANSPQAGQQPGAVAPGNPAARFRHRRH
jgi:hypothetical protein